MTTHTDAPADDLVERLEARTVQRLAQNWRKGLKCPECDADADRPKCMWDCGPSCPRLDPHAYDFSPYTSHPDPLSHEAAARIRSLEAQRDEAVGLLRESIDLTGLCTTPDRFGEAGSGEVFLRMTAHNARSRAFLDSLKEGR